MRIIVDADSFIYRAAINTETILQADADTYYQGYKVSKGIEYFNSFISNLTSKLNCKDYILVVGGGSNFRNIIYPRYKSNRKLQKRPIMLDIVREVIKNEYPIAYIPHLEADDTCRILLEEDKDNVLVSIDKDLRTFECKIFNPDKDSFAYVSKQLANNNFMKQLLTGDKVDGYSGLYGVGPKTVEKLLLSGITEDKVLDLYLEKGYTQDDFENIYNCAKILGKDDYNNGIITLYGGKKLDVRNK